jgi:PhzF family phenazine biosynthesis protein
MTMKIPAYHMDAFAGEIFSGNPAVVCPLDRWLDDEQLQLIAGEHYLPVTAFFVENGDHYELRWFTPTVELDICGHGTVAAAAVLFEYTAPSKQSVTFKTRSGDFSVVKDDQLICVDLPVDEAVACAKPPEYLVQALGIEPREILKSKNYLVIYDREEDIRRLAPEIDRLQEIECVGVIVTSTGGECDYVSRYFAPRLGLPEDAATGSTHCTLAPYWSARLGQRKLHAVQLSRRRGELWCEHLGDRVRLSAKAVRYSEGFLYV